MCIENFELQNESEFDTEYFSPSIFESARWTTTYHTEEPMQDIAVIGVRKAIEYLLPALVTAGKIAGRIQDALVRGAVVNTNGQKAAFGRFGAALTDADILVESFLGSVILTSFTDVTFAGEEHEQDRISAYFPTDGAYEITLDPVNGTLFFADGLPIYDIILTVRQRGAYLAAVAYLPRASRCFIGIAGEGAFTTTDRDIAAGAPWEPFALPPHRNVILTHRAAQQEIAALREAGFGVIDQEGDYAGQPDWTIALNSILTGGVVGLVKHRAHLIDWGAVGFISALAGGTCSELHFDPATQRSDLMIAAANRATYDRITSALAPAS